MKRQTDRNYLKIISERKTFIIKVVTITLRMIETSLSDETGNKTDKEFIFGVSENNILTELS